MGSGIDTRLNCSSPFRNNRALASPEGSQAGIVPKHAPPPTSAFTLNNPDAGKSPQFAAIFNANQPKTPTDWLQSTLGPGRILNQTA